MVRTQIYLPPEIHRRAKAKAIDLGISLTELVRRLLARELDQGREESDISRIFDLGDSGGSDIARYKHEYVGEAVEAHWVGEMRPHAAP